MPEQLLQALQDNPAVQQLNAERGTLPLPSLIEEALVISASYLQHPRPILVLKQNLYSAQRLYERVSALLSEQQCAHRKRCTHAKATENGGGGEHEQRAPLRGLLQL